MKFLLFFIGFEMLFATLHGQQPLEETLNDLIAEEGEGREDIAEYYLNTLAVLRQHPLDINRMKEEDWDLLGILTPLEKDAFFRYRERYGAFTSIYELQAIPGWSIELIRRVLPYLVLDSQSPLRETAKQEILGSLRWKSKTATEGRQKGFPGNSFRYFLRYRYQSGRALSIGATAEKDPGEVFRFNKNIHGFDYYSFHYFKQSDGRLKRLALGDYIVNMGQGLIQWQGFGFGKGSQVLQIKKEAPLFQPYRGSGESNFFRGAAASLAIKQFEIGAFASYRKQSGNRIFDSNNTVLGFTSINESGLHRTDAELQDRNAIEQFNTGFALARYLRHGKIGMNLIQTIYSLPLLPGPAAYQHFAITGGNWTNASVDYSFTARRLHNFGEFGIDKNFRTAWVHGILLVPDPRVDIAILFRRIAVDYRAVGGQAFTEQSAVNNETGIYAGMLFRISQRLQFSFYSDLVQYPWIRYRIDLPSVTQDYRGQIEWKKRKKMELRFYLRYRNHVQNESASQEWMPRSEFRAGVQMRKIAGLGSDWISRAELLRAAEGKIPTSGMLFLIGSSFKARSLPLSLAWRLSYYDNESRLSKIYLYEAEPGNFGNFLALSGTALRYSLIIKYELNRFMNLSLKLAQGKALGALSTNQSSSIWDDTQYSIFFKYVR